jgi:hypothetical protein
LPKLIISDLKPGMRLLKPVTNASGMVLLTEGLELTEELIERLHKMEIENVTVRGGNRPTRPKEELLAELEHRFKKTGTEPQMAVLKKILADHLEGLYQDNGL